MRKITSLIIIGCLFLATVAFTLNVEFVESTSETIFFDDFNDGVADGWAESTGGNGSWSVVDEEYFVSVGLVENGISTVNSLTLSDCIVEVKLRFTDAVGFRAGIIFRYTDNEHYYTFEVSNEYDRVQLFVFTPANPDYGWAPSPPPSYPISKDIEYTLRVEIHSNTFTGYLNGLEMGSLTDGNFTTGQVGLRARRADVFFDNFTVSRQTLITVPDDYPTIQEAINHANDGDTVFVGNGTYYENVVVNKTLNLKGENRNSTIIDGNNTGNVVTLLSNNASVSGFTVQYSAAALFSCIKLDHVSGCSIFSNTANNNHDGDGIFLQSSERNNISDNVVINTWDGITFWGSSHNTISGNTVVNRLSVGGTSIQFCYGSAFNQALDNAFLGIAQIGIRCYQGDSGSNVLIGNRVENHYHGIYADGSSNNVFYHNNIVNNTINQAYIPDSANVWDNGCEGNYWSNYNGTDLNGDGIGDAPYIIDESNQDNYPLINLYWNPADVDHDLDVDIFDLVRAAGAYGSTPSSPNWNPHCDIAAPYGVIDIFDIVTIAGSYGKKYGS